MSSDVLQQATNKSSFAVNKSKTPTAKYACFQDNYNQKLNTVSENKASGAPEAYNRGAKKEQSNIHTNTD